MNCAFAALRSLSLGAHCERRPETSGGKPLREKEETCATKTGLFDNLDLESTSGAKRSRVPGAAQRETVRCRTGTVTDTVIETAPVLRRTTTLRFVLHRARGTRT
jgi:hypothetical protein